MRFTVRRSPDRLRKISVLAAAFAIFSTVSFFVFSTVTGLVLLGISVAAVLVIAFELGKFGWYYDVGESSLTVRRTFRAYTISGDSIAKVTTEGWPGIRRAIDRVGTRASSGSGAGNRHVAAGRLIGFSAVPIPIKGPLPTGRETFVLIERTGDRVYVLSPEDARGFSDACRRLMSRNRG